MSPTSKKFDILVIGGGLSGLTVATAMSANCKVALIEKEPLPGGLCLIGRHLDMAGANFHSVPFQEDDDKAFDIIESLTNHSLAKEAVSSTPVCYDNGLKPFLGFGDEQPKYIDELEFYTAEKRWTFKESPGQWTQRLYDNFKGDFFGDSEVTSLITEDHQVLGVVVNGQQKLYAEQVIFCCDPKLLLGLLDDSLLSGRLRLRLAKSSLWTAVSLNLIHNHEVSTEKGAHIFFGKSEKLHPSIGFFLPAEIQDDNSVEQASQWITFLPDHEAENEESLGTAVKTIKKHIKRAFPEALVGLVHEKISVSPSSHGKLNLKLNEDLSIDGIENFKVVSPFLSEQKNLLASISEAKKALDSLGYRSAQKIL